MHKHLPTPGQRLGVWFAALFIFAAPALASWAADTATGTGTSPVSATVPAGVGGWDCTVDGVTCGNGTGTDR